MVYEVITPALQDEMIYMVKFYDKHGSLPGKKVRVNITLSKEIVEKIKPLKNKSRFIEGCISNQELSDINSGITPK